MEHKRLPAIARCLGVAGAGLRWPDEDYDSIWLVRYKDGAAVMERTAEGLRPGEKCPY